MRFNRDYRLAIGIGEKAVIITPPIRISFNAEKNATGSLGKLNLTIYNLKESTRLRLIKSSKEEIYIPVILEVGYDDKLELVFKGSVFKGSISRSGADFTNILECYDGGFDYRNSFTSRTVEQGEEVITTLLKDLPNTAKGKITEILNTDRAKVLFGDTLELIDKSLKHDQTWFIDNEQLHVLSKNEVVSNFVPVVSAKTGLINTPTTEQEKLEFTTILNPTIRLGGVVELLSKTAKYLNGFYKIENIIYKGDTHGQDWVQTCYGFKSTEYKYIK